MSRKFILSIDIGGTVTKLAIIDKNLKIRKKKIYLTDTNTYKSSQRLIDKLVRECEIILNSVKIQKRQIEAIGVGVPGLVDFSKGIIHYLPNIPYFKNTPFRKILEDKLGIRVFVDNDVNLMALAEARVGAASGAKNAVCLTLGTGVGGGIIYEGNLYRGSKYCAGEIGHMPVNVDGPICNCGGRACLESYIGNRAILRLARVRLRMKSLTMEKISLLAKKGNTAALKIFKDYALKLGVVLSGVINLLNPEVIVIGGGVSNAGDFLFSEIRKTVKERALSVSAKAVKIRKAKLGNDAGLIGAAILAKENC